MGKIRLVRLLVARDLRHRPAQAALLLLAITAATSILTLGLALHGVTSQPFQQTQAATNGPDVWRQPLVQSPVVWSHTTLPVLASSATRWASLVATIRFPW